MNDTREKLAAIDPRLLDYQGWLNVGMALKHEGATAADWDAWSQRDSNRYKAGECFKKWDGFRGSAHPVTGATLAKLAMDAGWRPKRDASDDHELDWEAEIGGKPGDDAAKIVDSAWLQDEELPEPGAEWDPIHDLTTYLGTLFQADEHVGYVTESWLHEGAHLPKKGVWDRTAGQLIEALHKCNGDIGSVLGDYHPEVGAWIRFNPLNGAGVRDENVTSFRYALVESDGMPVPRQYALMKELELPVAAMVHSGGKSLHAIVRIEADSYDEYRKRVDFLYEVCQRNGLKLDRQNRNPSRLSRMPGVMRNGHKQFLAGTNMGRGSWAEWKEWVEDLKDDLPDIEELTIGVTEPDLAPVLVEGVLREGHKLLLSGPSKAGKSFGLMQLCVAIAEGGRWFGWRIAQGRVLYVNLEMDPRTCLHRFWKIYRQSGMDRTPGMLDVWNLRGSACAMDHLAPKLIRRAMKKRYKAVVIDPIYKVLTGDENSASEMAKFCNQFDTICKELGAATIYCHHHSKGAQGQKTSRDRSSGSGVFARDPDAIIDMIELQVDSARRGQIVNRWECQALWAAFDKVRPGWREQCPQDEALVGDKLAAWALGAGLGDILREVRPPARHEAELATGWRVEGTVREFPAFPPKTLFFRYPLHVADDGKLLVDAKAEGEEAPWVAQRRERMKAKGDRQRDRRASLETAITACSLDGPVTVVALAEFMGASEKTIRRRIEEHGLFEVKEGRVESKREEGTA